MTDLPTAARSLLRQLDGWTYWTRPTRGQLELTRLSDIPDGNGKRRRVPRFENVDTVKVSAFHPDGRAFVALWVRRDGRGWSLDMAFKRRDEGEYAPKQLTATQLKAYVAGLEVAA